ncbi:hypothetical protein [Amycolatopsis tolypomycina]|uniref:Uncharacterized protein n=1 Tax=Amycolatopsis tolypomycina TaxID=208445 RepID=A0A1H4SVV3_9PSEU|nr:hypothetical protein [Amycolatopsis tolypomycina]SEC48198.1 hypothetical protein SAMN04489727_3913 [Amycolatopsis tolypomycina]
MPTRPPPPDNFLALVAAIIRDRKQTMNVAFLVVCIAFAAAVVLAPALVIMLQFGPTGAAAVGGVGALATAGAAARRARRRSSRQPVEPPGPAGEIDRP